MTDWRFLIEVIIRSVLAVLIGGAIGSERAKHGRAAGVRTHILVCLGGAMTSMTSVFVNQMLGFDGDVFRISAQVISGIGFLGAGMIILKSNNMITGLTTAAGVWTTGAIGVAVGYGFYTGAIVVTALFIFAIILFVKFEKSNKSTQVIYIELDNMYKSNETMNVLKSRINVDFVCQIIPAKSGDVTHIGINIVIHRRVEISIDELCKIDGVVYAFEEQ